MKNKLKKTFCTCDYRFSKEVDEAVEPNRYCPQCGRNLFKSQSFAWRDWARGRGIIKEFPDKKAKYGGI